MSRGNGEILNVINAQLDQVAARQIASGAPLELYRVGEPHEQTRLHVHFPFSRPRQTWLTIEHQANVLGGNDLITPLRTEQYYRIKRPWLRGPRLMYGGERTLAEGEKGSFPRRSRNANRAQAKDLFAALYRTDPDVRFVEDRTVDEIKRHQETRMDIDDHVDRIFTAAGNFVSTQVDGQSVTLPFEGNYVKIVKHDSLHADQIVFTFGRSAPNEYGEKTYFMEEFSSIPTYPLRYGSGEEIPQRNAYPEQVDLVMMSLESLTAERVSGYVKAHVALDGEVGRLLQLEEYRQEIDSDTTVFGFYGLDRDVFIQPLLGHIVLCVRPRIPVDAPDGTIEQYLYSLAPRSPLQMIIGHVGDSSPLGDTYTYADTEEMNQLTNILSSLPD